MKNITVEQQLQLNKIANFILKQLPYASKQLPQLENNTDVFVDHDGIKHLVFVDKQTKKLMLFNTLSSINSAVIGSGDTCMLRSRLLSKRLKGVPSLSKEFENNENKDIDITYLTVASLIRMTSFSNSIPSILSDLLSWIYNDQMLIEMKYHK